MRRVAGLLALLLLAHVSPLAQTPATVSGVVVDPTGAPVPDATVRVDGLDQPPQELQTARDGSFAMVLHAAATMIRVRVTAAGFAVAERTAIAGDSGLHIALEPAPFFEAVNVTSTRGDVPRADPTATVTVLSSSELLSQGAATLDDALKAVPGFTLFRRTSSRVSNPTAQGVALRGLGGTGASRSLVLADGLPLNDAFGGWVYWDKVPQVAIDRIEVQRGSGSDLYGADAVGGVVQILTVRPTRPTVQALAEGGSLGTGRVSMLGGGRTSGWTYMGSGEWFTTEGYIPVAVEQDAGLAPRGAVDNKAGSTHRSAIASAGYQTGNGWRFDGRVSVFTEDRKNGTPLVVNDTDARMGSGEVSGGLKGGLLSVRFFRGTQDYLQTFSTVATNRGSEVLNRISRVPTSVAGVGGQWLQPWGRHSVLLGAEQRFIDGTTIETPYTQGRPQTTTEAGGHQRVGSAFAQLVFEASNRLTIVAGAHVDGWHTESQETTYNKTLGAFNPRGSVAYRLGDTGVSLRGSVYRGFRAPTLNELYRGFRSGNTETRPNEALRPERLTGGDAGILFARSGASARVTAFWNVLDDTITNITLSSTPQLISKQRANADEMRAAGVELEGEVRVSSSLSVTLASAIVNSKFTGDTSLGGNRVPQIPRYNVGLNVRYTRNEWTGSGQFRVTGPQFEDDLNLFTLRRAAVLDLFGSRSVGGRLRIFGAIENVFDTRYDVARTPTLSTGLPRAVRAGVQLWVR